MSTSSSAANKFLLVDENQLLSITQEVTSGLDDIFKERYRSAYIKLQREFERERQSLSHERERFEAEKQEFERTKERVTTMVTFPNIVRLDVGGVYYTTNLETLRAAPNSLLDVMFSGKFEVRPGQDGRYFLDRNGKLFSYILDFLRNGTVPLPTDRYKRAQLLAEAEYFGIDIVGDRDLVDYSEDLPTDWTMTQSTQYTSGASNTAQALRDTNLALGVATNNSTNEWIKIHYKAPFYFQGVKAGPMLSGGWDAYTTGVQLESSMDGLTWTRVHSNITAAAAKIEDFKFETPVTAQYWRFSKTCWFALGYVEFY